MKIVIDIDKETYKHIMADSSVYVLDEILVENAIYNGTPLPEGHGDLIDADSLIKAIKEKAKRLSNADTINGLCGVVALIFDSPTIIEADYKAESEG